jgi:hypothetical protein
VLAEYSLAGRPSFARLAAVLAREACARFSALDRLRFVCGDGADDQAISVLAASVRRPRQPLRVQAEA